MPRLPLGSADRLLVAWSLLAKLGVLAIGLAALWALDRGPGDVLAVWDRWDAPHYTDIAVFGYMAHDPGTLMEPGYRQVYPGDADLYIVFFPLFPALVGAVNAVIDAPVPAAFVVTTLASLFVAPMLYRLVAVDLGHRVALWSAGMLLVFPTAYFLHIGYTESLFLALAFASLWLARTERWVGAGLLGGLAAFARINGLVLIPALAVEAFLQWREHRARSPWPAMVAVGLVAVGFGAYLLVNLATYGDPFAFSEIQRDHWDKALSPPWVGVGQAIAFLGDRQPDTAIMYGAMELLFVTIGLIATVVGALWFRPTWTAWMAGNWLLMVSTTFIASVPRYSLVLFGIVAAVAVVAERRPWIGWTVGALSAAAMGTFAWRFASGQWAF